MRVGSRPKAKNLKNCTENGGSLKTFCNFEDSVVSWEKGCDMRISHPGIDIMKRKRFIWRKK